MSGGLAVVTGATAGIGREFAEQLAGRGYDLLLVARDERRLAETAAALATAHGVEAEAFTADLSREEHVTRLGDRLATAPRLAMLINNAGFGSRGRLADADEERQAAMVRLHALAPLRLTRAALPVLLANRAGAVVNVSSVAGFLYSAGNANYCATKAYLTTLSEGLAAELHGTGVRVQALCPGFTRTEFHARIGGAVERHPEFAWLSARSVVAYSLRCLDRGGPVVCIPGFGYRVLVGVLRLVPRRLIGWVTRHRYDRV
ncbi:MAG TPA: SDR family oxidoreductase [Gemmatimonadales bacterium]|nr:SDR family oxidoreductase [Gemmatimonadales bacterium]